MINAILRHFEMLSPARMASLDIAESDRQLYDLRKAREDCDSAIRKLEARVKRLQDQYPTPGAALPTITAPKAASPLRQFIGRGKRT